MTAAKTQAASTGLNKALQDSSYISPVNNPRVIQDDDPVKVAAATEARKRYEAKVAARKAENENYIRQHAVNVKQEGIIVAREAE